MLLEAVLPMVLPPEDPIAPQPLPASFPIKAEPSFAFEASREEDGMSDSHQSQGCQKEVTVLEQSLRL